MIRQFAFASLLHFGAGLFMLESGGYLSSAVMRSLTFAAVSGCCSMCECVAFSYVSFFSDIHIVAISDGLRSG